MKTISRRMAKIASGSILILAFASGAQAQTTVAGNMSVGGDLTVTGASNLNGGVNVSGRTTITSNGDQIIIGGQADNIYIANEPGTTSRVEIGTNDTAQASVYIGGGNNVTTIGGVVEITPNVTIGGTSLTETLDSKASTQSVVEATSSINRELNGLHEYIDESIDRVSTTISEPVLNRFELTDTKVDLLDKKFNEKFEGLSQRVEQVDRNAKGYAAGAGASALAVATTPAGGGLGAAVYTVGGVQAVAVGAKFAVNSNTDLSVTVNHNSVSGTAGGVGLGMKW